MIRGHAFCMDKVWGGGNFRVFDGDSMEEMDLGGEI